VANRSNRRTLFCEISAIALAQMICPTSEILSRRAACRRTSNAPTSVREKQEFASGINADLPVQSWFEKIFPFFFSEIMNSWPPFRANLEGRYGQSSRNVGRGMRWT
jgi:hypothetical protein